MSYKRRAVWRDPPIFDLRTVHQVKSLLFFFVFAVFAERGIWNKSIQLQLIFPAYPAQESLFVHLPFYLMVSHALPSVAYRPQLKLLITATDQQPARQSNSDCMESCVI